MKFTTRIALSLFPARVWTSMLQEWPFARLRWRNRWLPSRRATQARLAALRGINLHLGCGRRVTPGWVNIDCFPAPGIEFECDFREPLPFSESAANLIYSEHVVEHLDMFEARHFLRECLRVLAPEGIIRLGVPDAETYMRAYVAGDAAFFDHARNIGSPADPLDTPIKIINQMARMGGHHLFAWDFQTLSLELERAGFDRIVRETSGHSHHPDLCLDDPSHAFETLYVEARKPGPTA